MASIETMVGISFLVLNPLAAVLAFAIAGPRMATRIQWAVWGLLFWPTVFLVIARKRRGEWDVPVVAVRRETPGPIPPPAEDAIAGLRTPFSACPDCGFLGIRPAGVQDGVFPGGGELIQQVCPRCNYRGIPVEFGRTEDYVRFLRELSPS